MDLSHHSRVRCSLLRPQRAFYGKNDFTIFQKWSNLTPTNIPRVWLRWLWSSSGSEYLSETEKNHLLLQTRSHIPQFRLHAWQNISQIFKYYINRLLEERRFSFEGIFKRKPVFIHAKHVSEAPFRNMQNFRRDKVFFWWNIQKRKPIFIHSKHLSNEFKQAENGLQSRSSENGKPAVWHYDLILQLYFEIVRDCWGWLFQQLDF